MGVSVVVFHPRSPLHRFSDAASLLRPGNPLLCSGLGLFVRNPAKACPPPRTTIRRRRQARLTCWQGYKRHFVLSFRRQGRTGGCRAHLAEDAPFAVAIGASILSSLVFPVPTGPDEDAEGSGGGGIDSTDTRFAVMGILSFIPYFNWMSWIFAWLDTGRQRYLVYSIVYLAPYLRTSLSLSPNDSWLPIASILACIVHIQLEASIRNGDINGITSLEERLKHLLSFKRKHGSDPQSHKEICGEEELRKKLEEGEVWRKSIDDLRHLKERENLNEEERN